MQRLNYFSHLEKLEHENGFIEEALRWLSTLHSEPERERADLITLGNSLTHSEIDALPVNSQHSLFT